MDVKGIDPNKIDSGIRLGTKLNLIAAIGAKRGFRSSLSLVAGFEIQKLSRLPYRAFTELDSALCKNSAVSRRCSQVNHRYGRWWADVFSVYNTRFTRGSLSGKEHQIYRCIIDSDENILAYLMPSDPPNISRPTPPVSIDSPLANTSYSVPDSDDGDGVSVTTQLTTPEEISSVHNLDIGTLTFEGPGSLHNGCSENACMWTTKVFKYKTSTDSSQIRPIGQPHVSLIQHRTVPLGTRGLSRIGKYHGVDHPLRYFVHYMYFLFHKT